MKLFRQADVYAPEPLGINDVLVAGGKIIKIAKDLSPFLDLDIEVIDVNQSLLVPGFVDSLVHITGGGGEGGFATRTPEMKIEEAIAGGVTTIIGVLGTDSITRSLENLLAKTYALEEQGISVFCYTGSYHIPAVTITESVTKDIMLINKFIGIGEVAIADHRSSQITVQELARLTSEARVAGMLANKAGIVSIHVGDEPSGLSILHQVTEQTDIPITQFYPTHINRTSNLLSQGIKFAQAGGFLDFTTSTNEQILASGEVKAAQALAMCLDKGINVSQLTMSSDGNASLPVFDEQGALIDLQVGEVKSLHLSFVEAVTEFDVPIDTALTTITKSPANILKLQNKGRIQQGYDADINLLNKSTLAVSSVYAKGIKMT
ncbi:beta-aspartyl-peptidase [Thalassotalea sediminis]|uniref:beta-aspartyl-peptidase n=1 Tax=Thalassotalea sediminis TaxID=1759089 RepID=UPI002573381E|nr:beta-aspartyl-peptidase [Thalassotalea sediminis]